MVNKATAVIQARLSSTRLPGKVLLPLVNKPVIQHVYERILSCKRIDRIVVATSQKPQDDKIYKLFQNIGVPVFRGSEDDPLERYFRAAEYFGLKHLVRIMADCPLVDPKIVDDVVNNYFKGGYDVCCLSGQFPTGLDVTVFSYDTVKKSSHEALLRSEREHVTPYMLNNPELFKVGKVEKFSGLQQYRWVMDHKEDYELIKKIYNQLYNPHKVFCSAQILDLLREEPHLTSINSHISRDEGYKLSVKQDSIQK